MNRKTAVTLISLLTLLLFMALIVAIGSAQGTAPEGQTLAPEGIVGTGFTYQGRLDRSDGPVEGVCNIAFRLYQQASGGTLVGAPVTTTVTLDHGLFTTYLDFGAGSMDGHERWLEVTVRCPSDAAFTTLPRQSLTPTPYALYATAAPWSGLIDVPPGLADGVDNDTQYQAGAGLMLQYTAFSVDFRSVQQRVTGLCPAGQAVRQIEENGTVVCETTYNGDITAVDVGPGLLGGGATGVVTVTANTAYLQRRIEDGCLGESSIKKVYANGTVDCEADSDTAYLAGNQLELTGSASPYTLNVKEGASSGLDADMLDGQGGAFYQDATNLTTGVLSADRFSAHGDLLAEGFLGDALGDLAQNNGNVQVNLNADQLDGHGDLFYTNAGNLVAGTLSTDRFSAFTDLQVENKLGTEWNIALNNGIMQPGLNAQYLNGYGSGDYQRRVTGNCAEGQAIREIFDTGAVWCQMMSTGDITSVSPGIGLLGGALSGDATLSADTNFLQKRVSGSCAEGNSIRVILPDGTVTCEPDSGTTYTAGAGISISADNAISVVAAGLDADSVDGKHAADFDAIYVNEGQANSITSAMITDGAIDDVDLADGTALAEITDDDGSGSGLDADLLDGSHSSTFALSGSARVTDEYKVELNSSTDSGSTTMIATSAGFCFLVRVALNSMDQNQDAQCLVRITGTNWEVYASKDAGGDDDSIFCYARCYQW